MEDLRIPSLSYNAGSTPCSMEFASRKQQNTGKGSLSVHQSYPAQPHPVTDLCVVTACRAPDLLALLISLSGTKKSAGAQVEQARVALEEARQESGLALARLWGQSKQKAPGARSEFAAISGCLNHSAEGISTSFSTDVPSRCTAAVAPT